MRIGILTYFWAENPGTFLQAYSMLCALRKRFPHDTVELVNYRHRRVYFKPNPYILSMRLWRKEFARYKTYRRMQKRYLTTSTQALISHSCERAWEFIDRQQYDVLVVGSDTILELKPRHTQRDELPAYWLPPHIACDKIMCAASARAVTYEQLSDIQRTALKASVNGFRLLGVRDHATFNLIKAIGLQDESRLQLVPDPTFSYQIDHGCVATYLKKKRLQLPERTVLLHLPGTCVDIGQKLADHFRGKGFGVASLGSARNVDVCLTDLSPFEWAGVFRRCALVITHRFHDTLFSLKNLRPVVAIEWDNKYVTSEGHSKYHSLLQQFGLAGGNLVRMDNNRSVAAIIEAAVNAMGTFDARCVHATLVQMQTQFATFVDDMACLL